MAIAGAVLAGGRSRRMGRDKALIIVDGETLAERTASILSAGGCDPVHIVGRQPALQKMSWPVITETGTAHHPLLGVCAALTANPDRLVLVAPCDIVNLSVAHITPLLRHGSPCVAEADGRTHPLLAVFPGSYAQRAADLAARGAPAMALCEGLERVTLVPPVLIDANQTTDLPR